MSSTPTLALRFYNWQCGHHSQRPDDIAVSSPDQATQILHAMSHCISQPGSFNAWLLTETRAITAYVTDDYVRMNGDHQNFPQLEDWNWGDDRPVLVYGTPEQIAELNHPDNAEAVDNLWFIESLTAWDGKSYIEEDMVTSTLSLVELQNLCRPRESYEPYRPELYHLPPVFRTAESVLDEVRAERASIEACKEDIADEAGIFSTPSVADIDRAHGKVVIRDVFDQIAVQTPGRDANPNPST